MKTFLKRFFYTLMVCFMLFFFLGTFASNKLFEQLEQMSQLHYENSTLTDAAFICMQLYFFNPTKENRETCILIQEKITHNKSELQNLTLATLYLNYLEKTEKSNSSF